MADVPPIIIEIRDSMRQACSRLDALTFGVGTWDELKSKARSAGFRQCCMGENPEMYAKLARRHVAERERNALYEKVMDACIADPRLPEAPARSKDAEHDIRDSLARWCTQAARALAAPIPSPASNDKPAPRQRDMTALRQLAARESWRLNDLPVGIGVEILRVLDSRGFVEVRGWVREAVSRQRGENRWEEQPWPHGWFSPISKPEYFGGWEGIFSGIDPPRKPAPEVRVTERGRAELTVQGETIAEEPLQGQDSQLAEGAETDDKKMGAGLEQGAHRQQQPPDEGRYLSAAVFGKKMAGRLRMAARDDRKTKRVRTKKIDGVVCYCVKDVRQWWPRDIPPGI